MPGRILLANEAGTGRGHITTLKVFAQALGPGFIYDAALCRLHHAADLAPFCDMVFQGAGLGYQPDVMGARNGLRIGNWAEFLGAIGFASEDFLVRQIDWWINTIRARCSGLVVAEFAPCAMLAAHALGVPVISIGQGHSTPPAGMAQFPLPPSGAAGLFHDEAELLETVNRAGARFGVPPLQYFSDVYRCQAQLPRTIPQLDPYADIRVNPTYLPPLGPDSPAVAQGEEVFVYFSTTEGEDPVITEAIANVRLPMRVVMPEITDDYAARLEAGGGIVERQPLPHGMIAARSRMIVHAGQHGATAMGLGMGLPQVAFPCQSEQEANASCMVAMGVGAQFAQPRNDAAAITEIIERIYADAAMRTRARDLAGALRLVLVGDTQARVRGVVEAVMRSMVVA